jgi:membrane-associated phospholipid phosphatase
VYRVIIIVGFILLLSNTIQADTIFHSPRKYIYSFFSDTKDIVLFPKRWNSNQWILAGTITAATGALIIVDDNIQSWVQSHKTSGLNDISKYIAEPWGTNKFHKNYSLIASAGFLSYGIIANDSKATHCAFSGVKAFFLTGALTYIPKSIFGRQRPNQKDGPDNYDWRGAFQGESFFSGHTSVSFAFASVVAEYYKTTKWVPIVSYTFASLTGLSRIYDNKHWASDVLAGAAFGIAIGKLVARNDQLLFISYNPEFNSPMLTCSIKF